MKTKTKPNFTFLHPSFSASIKYHHASTDNINAEDRITFLTLWFSHFVFCFGSLQVAKQFIRSATHLHEKINVFLSKLILGNLYKSLVITSRYLKVKEDHEEKYMVSIPIWLL